MEKGSKYKDTHFATSLQFLFSSKGISNLFLLEYKPMRLYYLKTYLIIHFPVNTYRSNNSVQEDMD